MVQNESVSLREEWDGESRAYLDWTRTSGHDVGFWEYNLPALLALLPDPGNLTVDVGCGEGRFGRELIRRGHRVVGIDSSRVLAEAASTHHEPQPTVLGMLQSLPLAANTADLVTASMVLMNADDVFGCIAEVARILAEGGHFCFSILHPINTAGAFTHRNDVDAPFVVSDSYFEDRRQVATFDRDGLRMSFTREHRPLSEYFSALTSSGFVVDRLTEPQVTPRVARDDPNWLRWTRVPNTLHVSALLRQTA